MNFHYHHYKLGNTQMGCLQLYLAVIIIDLQKQEKMFRSFPVYFTAILHHKANLTAKKPHRKSNPVSTHKPDDFDTNTIHTSIIWVATLMISRR
jgi:hypothetical protein